MRFHVQLCSVRRSMSSVSAHSVGGGPFDSWVWSKASCACRPSVISIQLPVLGTRPCVTTPVGGFWWASYMHRCILWAYARGSGRPSAAVVICPFSASSAPYKLHVGRWGAGAPVTDCRTRCMLSCTRSSSNSMVSSWTSRPLGSVDGASRRWGGSLVASTSMMLLWVDVWDCAVGPSDAVSDVLQESICGTR